MAPLKAFMMRLHVPETQTKLTTVNHKLATSVGQLVKSLSLVCTGHIIVYLKYVLKPLKWPTYSVSQTPFSKEISETISDSEESNLRLRYSSHTGPHPCRSHPW